MTLMSRISSPMVKTHLVLKVETKKQRRVDRRSFGDLSPPGSNVNVHGRCIRANADPFRTSSFISNSHCVGSRRSLLLLSNTTPSESLENFLSVAPSFSPKQFSTTSCDVSRAASTDAMTFFTSLMGSTSCFSSNNISSSSLIFGLYSCKLGASGRGPSRNNLPSSPLTLGLQDGAGGGEIIATVSSEVLDGS